MKYASESDLQNSAHRFESYYDRKGQESYPEIG